MGVPGSAVQMLSCSVASDGNSIASKMSSSSPTTACRSRLATTAMERDVLRSPVLPEEFGSGGELADQGDEIFVLGVASGFEAQHRRGISCYAVEVDEVLPNSWVEVEKPGGVGGSSAGRAGGCGL